MHPNDPKLKSFVTIAKDSHFPIQNLPYGVFTTPANYSPRVGVAIGDQVLDLSVLEQAGLLDVVPGERLFNRPTLNPFIERGPDAWRRAREAISDLHRGVPLMSRTLLSTRLKQLEEIGVVGIHEAPRLSRWREANDANAAASSGEREVLCRARVQRPGGYGLSLQDPVAGPEL